MPVMEFEGKTTEEAIAKASQQLHIPANELKVEIITTGSSGIFGFGGKKARIRVIVEEKISEVSIEAPQGSPVEPILKETDFTPPQKTEAAPTQKKEERPRGRRRREPSADSAEKGEGSRGETGLKARKKTDRPKREPFRPAKQTFHEDEDEEEVILSGPLAPTVPGPGEELYVGPEDSYMASCRTTLQAILEHMGVQAKVMVIRISDRIILNIEGDDNGLLIGKKGATLDALQFLMNKIANKKHAEKIRVVVDAENYRERRHQSLIELAQRMAEKARKTKRPVTISQLSAHDRRVIHLVLQDQAGLQTRSRGEGPLKNVVVIPVFRKDHGASPRHKEPRNGTVNNQEFKNGPNSNKPVTSNKTES